VKVMTMNDINRQSPVRFASKPLKTELRDHWPVVLEYEEEGPGPWLVDLSHKTRWDFQDGRLDEHQPAGIDPPADPGSCRLAAGILVNRMNRTQAAIWHLGRSDPGPPVLPAQTGYTDVSEATAALALLGPGVFGIAEKLSAIDFMDPGRRPPFLLQGPFAHVPCQIVALKRDKDGSGVILITCSRGYARDMVHAVLDAGAEFGLRPAGENAFASGLDDG
jgi:hypothetical protein